MDIFLAQFSKYAGKQLSNYMVRVHFVSYFFTLRKVLQFSEKKLEIPRCLVIFVTIGNGILLIAFSCFLLLIQ